MNERGQQWAPGAEIPPKADKIPDPPPPVSGLRPTADEEQLKGKLMDELEQLKGELMDAAKANLRTLPAPEERPALNLVDDPQDWRRQNQLDLALSHAVRIACEQPRLIGSIPPATGGERLSVEEVAQRITTMARTFAKMLGER